MELPKSIMLVFIAMLVSIAINFAAAAPVSYMQTVTPMPTITKSITLSSASAVCIPGHHLYPGCMRHIGVPTVCAPGYALYPECMRHDTPARVDVAVVNETIALNTTTAPLEARMRLPVCLEQPLSRKSGHERNDYADSGYAKSHAHHGCRELQPIHPPRLDARGAPWNTTANVTDTLKELPMNGTIAIDHVEAPEEPPVDETSTADRTETSEEPSMDETSTVNDAETPRDEATTVKDTETQKKLPVCVPGTDNKSTYNRSDCYSILHYSPVYHEPKWEKYLTKATEVAMKGIMTVAPFIPFMASHRLRRDIENPLHLHGHGAPRLIIDLNGSPLHHHLDSKNHTHHHSDLKNHTIGEKHKDGIIIDLEGFPFTHHGNLKNHTAGKEYMSMEEKHIIIHGKNVTIEEKHITIEGRRIPCQPTNPHHIPGCENPPKISGPIGLNGSPLLKHPKITNLTIEDRRLHCEPGNSYHLPACGPHNRPNPTIKGGLGHIWLSRPAAQNGTHGNSSDLEWNAGKHSTAQTTLPIVLPSATSQPASVVFVRDVTAQTILPIVPQLSPTATSSLSFLTIYTRDLTAQTTLPVVPELAPINAPSQIPVTVHSRRSKWDDWLIHF